MRLNKPFTMIIERVLTTKIQPACGSRSIAEQAAWFWRLRDVVARRRPERSHHRRHALPSGVAEDRLERRRRLRHGGKRDRLGRGVSLRDTGSVGNTGNRRLGRQRATERRGRNVGADIGPRRFKATGQFAIDAKRGARIAGAVVEDRLIGLRSRREKIGAA
jgi:hypothetical protein